MAVTLKEIAEKASVGISSVSATLKGNFKHVGVGEEKQKRIREVAAELNYSPNFHARSLVTGRSPIIAGFRLNTLPDPLPDDLDSSDLYFTGLQRGIDQVCQASNIYAVHQRIYLPDLERSMLPRGIRDGSIGGVIHLGSVHQKLLEAITVLKIPTVAIGQGTENKPDSGVDVLYADLDAGIERFVDRLAELGHRHIQLVVPGYAGERRPEPIGEQFRALNGTRPGLRLETACLDARVNIEQEKAEHYAAQLVQAGEYPTAYICSERYAEGLAEGFARAGVACPRDVSIVAYGSTRKSFLAPQHVTLSMIVMPQVEIGRRACRRLLERMDNPGPVPQILQSVPCKHSEAESIGPVSRKT